jgi:glyoxylase-like metal-dependent hydrolase (beta-lactamase superfamily II)
MTLLEVPGHDIVGVRAANPGPFTLTGTNSWIVGRGPAWVVDPGPALDEHLAALWGEISRRGGLGGIALTHDHADHSGAVPAMRGWYPGVPVAGARGDVDMPLTDGDEFGPLQALSLPGHAPDHLVFIAGTAALTGDAVLGEGSVFIAPDPGALVAYLDGLARLGQRSVEELLDEVWSEVPLGLRPAATVTLAAHLDKLEGEGRLPPGVERPAVGIG